MLKSTDILLVNKATGQPIGYVKKLSIHFSVDSFVGYADWQTYRPSALEYQYFKGDVVSIKWTGASEHKIMYLTVEVSNIQEVKE